MIYLRDSSEDEMILEFLKGEIKSERFQAQIFDVLSNQKISVDIIEKADLSSLEENKRRKEILGIFRGYGCNTQMFVNFPNISSWIYAECSHNDINNIRYINYSYWNELSKNTSSPLVAAKTIREGVEIYGVPNTASISGLEYLEKGGSFPPIILLTADMENFIILEGHSRMTVYGLDPKFFGDSKCYIGVCEETELSKWNS